MPFTVAKRLLIAPVARVVALSGLVHFASLMAVGGDWMTLYRLAVPVLPLMYVAITVLGFALGIASTSTLTGIIALAPTEARATALSLRITGNRVGQVLLPFLAGVVAAATGVAGILLALGFGLAASGIAMAMRQPPTTS